MRKKIVLLILSCLMVSALVLASCGEAEVEEEEEVIVPTEEEEVTVPTEEEEVVVPPGEGNWWDKFGEPEYGGTFTFSMSRDVNVWDPYYGEDYTTTNYLYLENLAHQNWTLDRNICSYQAGFFPINYYAGWVAESWEAPDYSTCIFHIRPGIHWQDKPPANGRELTAYDVAWSFNRQWGCGDGFTEISPYIKQVSWECYDEIYATDKYTMVVKHHNYYSAWGEIIQPRHTHIYCKDAVLEFGDLKDWRNAIGTGPFILKDVVAGASITLVRNPNYWGYDERHPENQLPYVDGIKILIIPDTSTRYAALRTGKIEMVGGVPWEQAEQLQKTNPELKWLLSGLGMSQGLRPKIYVEPFNDIRVRKAMNMAIDRETIAETIYGGYGDPKVLNHLGPEQGDYYTPFEEWPKELQEEYTYNPEGARKLLAEAGYPNGFKTNVVVEGTTSDECLIFKEYLKDIGIDMEIKVLEAPAFFSYVNLYHKHDQMAWDFQAGAWTLDTEPGLNRYKTGYFRNNQEISDPIYDEMVNTARVDENGNPRPDDEIVRRYKECDMYILKNHWRIPGVPTRMFMFYQPWFGGYSGESTMMWPGSFYARFWIDHDIKEAMGYE